MTVAVAFAPEKEAVEDLSAVRMAEEYLDSLLGDGGKLEALTASVIAEPTQLKLVEPAPSLTSEHATLYRRGQ